MKNKTGVIPIIIIGLIVIGLSIAFFFLLEIERTTLNIVALVFLLLSELVLFSGLIYNRFLGEKHDKTFMNAGITVILLLYFFVTLISILFTGLFKENINSFILMEIFIIALTSIIVVIIFISSRKIATDNKQTIEARGFMDYCEKRIFNALNNPQNKEYAALLKSVYENIKYSDKIGTSTVDTKIEESITNLETTLNDGKKGKKDIAGLLDEITSLINQRKMEISNSKRGGF